MKFESNTVGNFENPQDEEIEKAFFDKDSINLSGNIFCIGNENFYLQSISGENKKNYTLEYHKKNHTKKAKDNVNLQQALNFFIKANRGDFSWTKSLNWISIKKRNFIIANIYYIFIAIILIFFILINLEKIFK